jgi:hypothetical protein
MTPAVMGTGVASESLTASRITLVGSPVALGHDAALPDP